MTWGIPTDTFLQIHIILSLIGIASGLVALYGLLTDKLLRAWTALFLATTVLTSVTGFPLPPFGLDPPRIVGIISLVLLAAAIAALYLFHLTGAWRWIYVATAMAALYLNSFVGVVQSYQKLAFLQPLASTQSIAHVVVLVAIVGLGILAARRFRPPTQTSG